MLYITVRPIATIALSKFFRKIHLAHAERIPKDKPIILAANHPTAFLEPCLLACWLDEPLHFLVRGDLFAKPFYDRLLRDLNMRPVFRLKDGGYKKLKDNYTTFNDIEQVLANRQTIMILAEGNTKHEKRLRPLQKGTARIALGTLDKEPDLDIQVVPVGVNYTYAEEARCEVMIQVGEPMPARDYLERYRENNNQGIAALTDDLRDQLEKIVIIIDDPADEMMADRLFQLFRNDHPIGPRPVLTRSEDQFRREKAIADQLNQMEPAEKESWKKEIATYWKALETKGITDRGLVRPQVANWSGTLWIILGFPIYLVGYVLNWPPIGLANFVRNNKVKAIEFKASVALAVSMVAYILYLLLIGTLAGLIFGWPGLLLWLILPVLGYVTLMYRDALPRWQEARRARRLPAEERAALLRRREQVRPGAVVHSSSSGR